MCKILRTCIFLLLTQRCYNASIEYMQGTGDSDEGYEESDEQVSDDNNANVDARRTFYDSEEEDPSFDDIVFADASDTDYYNDTKIIRNLNNITEEKDNENVTIEYSIEVDQFISNVSDIETTTKTPLRPEDVLMEYHYDYSEVDSPNYIPQQETKSVSSTETYILLVTNKTYDTFSELYNIEPAVDILQLNVTPTKNQRQDSWYVMEDYPCWELPLIYGEIDQAKSKFMGDLKQRSLVFQMYPKYLKNVIDHSTVEETVEKDDNIQYNVNKWCRIAPCYGDHTMCLFPKKVTSGFCGFGYTVSVPPINEQTAFIFSLNSMRNAVASGGKSHYHPHIPRVTGATNMKKVLYDYELQLMAERWLHQCLPGPSPCDSLDNTFVSQLECTKLTEYCCMEKTAITKCSPKAECFVKPLIGCLHEWFWKTTQKIDKKHLLCGYIEQSTFSTVQLLWAKTQKVGCAFGNLANGDVRVVCNFSPGAPFYLETQYLCGVISQADNRPLLPRGNITDIEYLANLGFILKRGHSKRRLNIKLPNTSINVTFLDVFKTTTKAWGVVALPRIYPEGWIRRNLHMYRNGTKGMVARLVTRYTFKENTLARCDTEESVFDIGTPGSKCKETGTRHDALCYDFIDVVPGYRMIALLASIPLFTLILYDLFSTSMKQVNY